MLHTLQFIRMHPFKVIKELRGLEMKRLNYIIDIYENGTDGSSCYIIDKEGKLGVYVYVKLERDVILKNDEVVEVIHKLSYRER